MAEHLDQLYQRLASGEALPPLQPHESMMLLSRAERAARAETPEERMAGLRVAASVGGRDAMPVIGYFLRDPDRTVRRYAFDLGVAARQDGLPIVREAIADPDESLAVDALRLLTIAVDKASTTRARSVLKSTSAAVRAAAAELLGHVAGPAVRPELHRLIQDPDDRVRRVAVEALERVEGRKERGLPGEWWEAPPRLASPSADGAPQPNDAAPYIEHLAPENMPDAPPTERSSPLGQPEASPDEGLRGVPQNKLPDRLPLAAEAPSNPEPQPANPTTPDAVVSLLRRAGATGALGPEVIGELAALSEQAIAQAARAWRPEDPELGRGVALAAMHSKAATLSSTVRRMLSDKSPGVRAAAAEAIGHLGGGVALVNAIGAALADSNPVVRAAAVRGLGALNRSIGRGDLVRQRLQQVTSDRDENVKKAVEEVLATLT